VTPKSYLSFIDSFKKLYNMKKEELMKGFKRLNDGLEKLDKASKDVDEMSKKLEIEKGALKIA